MTNEQPRDEDGRFASSGTTVPTRGGSASGRDERVNVVEVERHDISGQTTPPASYPSHWTPDIARAVEQGRISMRAAERVAQSRRLSGR